MNLIMLARNLITKASLRVVLLTKEEEKFTAHISTKHGCKVPSTYCLVGQPFSQLSWKRLF